MIPDRLIAENLNIKKTYCLCESNFLYNMVSNSSKSKNKKNDLIIEHFFVTKENGTIYLYIEKETFNKLSICKEIIRSMNVSQLVCFLDTKNSDHAFTQSINIMRDDKEIIYKAFIKLYTLPPDQLETRINQYRLERM